MEGFCKKKTTPYPRRSSSCRYCSVICLKQSVVCCSGFWGVLLRIESLYLPSGCVRDAFGMRSGFDSSSIDSRSVFDRSSIGSRSVFDHPSIILRSSFVRSSIPNRRTIEERLRNDRRSSIVSSEDNRRII